MESKCILLYGTWSGSSCEKICDTSMHFKAIITSLMYDDIYVKYPFLDQVSWYFLASHIQLLVHSLEPCGLPYISGYSPTNYYQNVTTCSCGHLVVALQRSLKMETFSWFCFYSVIWRQPYRNLVSGISDYTHSFLWDIITSPCLRHILLAPE